MYLDDIEDDVIYTLADVESSFSIPKMKLIKCASLEERKIRLCIPLEQYHEVMLININELIDPLTKSYMNLHLACIVQISHWSVLCSMRYIFSSL